MSPSKNISSSSSSAAHGPTKTRQEAVSLLHSAHLIVVLKNGQVPWKRVVSVVIVVANFFLKKCVPKKELFREGHDMVSIASLTVLVIVHCLSISSHLYYYTPLLIYAACFKIT